MHVIITPCLSTVWPDFLKVKCNTYGSCYSSISHILTLNQQSQSTEEVCTKAAEKCQIIILRNRPFTFDTCWLVNHRCIYEGGLEVWTPSMLLKSHTGTSGKWQVDNTDIQISGEDSPTAFETWICPCCQHLALTITRCAELYRPPDKH